MKSLLFRHFIYAKLGPRARALPVADTARAQSVPWSADDAGFSKPRKMPGTATGKLIGAGTHVLVNDLTMGYGIFIENMLDAEA